MGGLGPFISPTKLFFTASSLTNNKIYSLTLIWFWHANYEWEQALWQVTYLLVSLSLASYLTLVNLTRQAAVCQAKIHLRILFSLQMRHHHSHSKRYWKLVFPLPIKIEGTLQVAYVNPWSFYLITHLGYASNEVFLSSDGAQNKGNPCSSCF